MKASSARPTESEIDLNPNRTVQPQGFPPLPANWASDWAMYPSADGRVKLFGVLHHAEPWTRGRALVVLHGMGEHGGRYLHFPHYVQNEVDAVLVYDHRGHGRSEGLRGHVESFDLFADDAAALIRSLDERLRSKFGSSEIHLFGHSLGGHIALRTLLLHPGLPLASASISAPFLAVKAKVPFAKKLASSALSKLWGSVQLRTQLDAGYVSRDAAVVEAYRKDRLVHDRITPQLFEDMAARWKDTLKRRSGIEVPIQFLIPLDDHIVDADVSQKYAEALESDDKRVCTYPEFYHEPFNEPGKERPFADLAEWIRRHHSRNAKGSSS